MKSHLLGKCTFSAALLLLPLLGGCSPQASDDTRQPATNAAPVAETNLPPTEAAAPQPDAGADSTTPDNSTVTGALPPSILPQSPLAQVIRLTQAGVDEGVILTYITNSGSTFNLDSDKIIYLKDIGLPNEVVNAMMQHDQQLQQQMAASAYQPPAQPATTPETAEPPEVAPAETVEEQPPQPVNVTYNYFYDTLAPYGGWVEVDGYGRCWRPTVVVYNPGWQPYCDHGHWVYTDCGWYWLSDYSWGWATFHYGRWFHHPHWGWCWWPETTWGPSWVTWRRTGDYCGWAPLPPGAVYRAGIGIFFDGHAVGVGFDFGLDAGCFTFVPTRHFCDLHPHRYRVPTAQGTQIFNRTTVINNFNFNNRTFVNNGIPPRDIAAVTGTEIHPIAIHDGGDPAGRGEQLGRDGRALFVNRPHFADNPVPPRVAPRPETSGQNNFPPPNRNWSAPPATPENRVEAPRAIPRGPQNRNEISVSSQPPAPPANNFPPPAAQTAPNYNNRVSSPRGQQQFEASQPPRGNPRNSEAPAAAPVPGQRQFIAPEVNHSAPAAAPAERPQRNESRPAHSEPAQQQRSDRQEQNQSGPGH